MAILLTWELGANAGYVNPLSAIALELKQRGHDVLVGVKDLAAGEKYLTPLGIDIVQAPIWNGHIDPRAYSAVNYAELLMLAGYLDIEHVSGQIRSWSNIIKMFEPSMILANHSPAVLLAVRILGVPVAQFGTGFCLPPVVPLMPSMQPWAHRLSSQGLVIKSAPNLPDYSELIERVHNSIELKTNVNKFHKNYGDTNPQYQLAALVDDIEGNLVNIH